MKDPRHTRRRTLAPALAALMLSTAGIWLAAGHRAAGQQPENAHVVPAPAQPAQPPAAQPAQPPAEQPPSPAQSAPAAPAPPAQAAPAPPAVSAAPAVQAAPSATESAPAVQAAPPAPSAAPSATITVPSRTPTGQPAGLHQVTVGGPAGGGGQLPAGAPLFGEQIEVRVVNVEAVVTDRSGNRVPDLKPSDFVLKVDGKPIKIEYFSEVRGGQAIAPQAGATETVPGLPDLAPGSPVGTSYLVFVDDYFSIAADRNLVLRSLKEDLTRLGPEDRMAIVAFDGRHLQMLTSWSSSQHDLGRAIDIEMGNDSHGLERVAELRNFRFTEGNGAGNAIAQTHGAFARGELSLTEQGFVEQLGAQVERVVRAAVGTLRGFATPPGRKVMMLLSGGWPFSPTDYAINNVNRPITQAGLPSGEKLLAPLVATANRLGYTLYPVDVPGMETATADASRETAQSAGNAFGLREQEHEGTLVYLAKETGGEALLNSRRLGAVTTVEADTRAYYWVGFTPSWQGNDKSHSIQLAMNRPGLQVRTRDSFLDRSRKAEVSMMVESAMMFGNAPGAPQLAVQLGKPVKTARREMEVPVTLAIPTDAFTTVPLNGKYAAELELRVAVEDENGERADIPVIPLQLQSEQQPLPGHYVRYQTKLKMRREGHHVIFAIFDPLSNRITLAESDVKSD